MSFRGKKYDGDFFGSGADITERGNPVNHESKIGRNVAAKRPARQIGSLSSEENLFPEKNDEDRYLITYSDLITLLLGFFIILYAISKIDAAKYKNVAHALGNYFGNEAVINPAPEMKTSAIGPKETLGTQLNRLIKEYNYSNTIQLEENEKGITIHILDEVLFAPAQAGLNENSKIVLNRLAEVIKDLPNDIRIEGHTDNVPINTARYPSNWHLSVDRALSTAYYLIKEDGLDPDKVSILGYAEYRPIAPNDTPENRAKNRRVDLVILK